MAERRRNELDEELEQRLGRRRHDRVRPLDAADAERAVLPRLKRERLLAAQPDLEMLGRQIDAFDDLGARDFALDYMRPVMRHDVSPRARAAIVHASSAGSRRGRPPRYDVLDAESGGNNDLR